MKTIINIQPIDMHIVTATQLAFQITNIRLGQSASFHWEIWGDNNTLIMQGSLEMDGEDYQGWNDDLPYVEKWICKKLKVEKLEEIIPAINEVEENLIAEENVESNESESSVPTE